MKNMPNFETLTSIAKKNMEAYSEVAQTASEGLNEIFRRNAEMTQNRITDSFNMAKDVVSSTSPEQVTSRQQEFFRKAAEDAVANSKEMMDLVSKCSMDVISSFGQVSESCFKESKSQHATKK